MFKVKVYVTLKKSVLDPQGVAVKDSLNSMDYSEIEDVRIGKYMEVMVNPKERSVETVVNEICDKLLANPVMENYWYEIEEVEEA
ncbi:MULTISPECIES: phosphoribosylformylglycinamidine synthase subunit PurS [Brochothrix]|uniref:Phosphoribosylformylglycinamidine synthase subunit PurS n=1 Tax=Brochothrix thermosphacta TaxID=2756 RepID=A0A1D2K8G7_BROTH|nr:MULTISPECIES: phosphoribosylformylglycinamidine synthase subunit PurS [Brochothrix]SLM95524.1 Phosphoribosylformylglycinamidine synthase, PurS subunit [Brachybacterium faecium]ANZ94596.1 phosphoribosylformylglycinamidine synthase subunit PurS [Brochothrix thermosphacta]ANZ97093.1 phosphoribosylformylglycinamidine synthase subunit PurS [Brochothrix thermosphacta]ATF26518.1 phosphoribosylformylglycinamidine synthase subunit PurS [Brochothrix thermosphacta]ATH85872.1 phosphoribosylformylglycin